MSPTQFHNEKYNNNINIKREPNSTNYITTTTTSATPTTTTTTNNNVGLYPPSSSCLKINKESHLIRKQPVSSAAVVTSRSPPAPSPSSTTTPTKPRHPVIIYTHSPKVIHTHPKDFMALVQKLTGLSRPTLSSKPSPLPADCDDKKKVVQLVGEREINVNNKTKNNCPTMMMTMNKDKDIMENSNSNSPCSSGVTDDDNHPVTTTSQQVLNSCYMGTTPYYDASSSYLTSIPVFTPNISVDHYFCSNNQINSNSPQQTSFYNYGDPLFFTPNMRGLSSSSSALTFEGINNDFRDY